MQEAKKGEKQTFFDSLLLAVFYSLMLQNMHFATKLHALTENQFQFFEKKWKTSVCYIFHLFSCTKKQ